MSSLHEIQTGSNTMKKLPVSINDFETLRTQGYVYVDKTPYIHRMVTQGKFYFLARPRRFGKSVLVTTLKALFQGKRDLFEDLWIAKQDDVDWKAHPVIIFDFTGISNTTPERLQEELETHTIGIAERNRIILKTPSLMSKFRELVFALSDKTGMPVAILIDEYDKPIIDHLGREQQELEIAKANRDTLKRFFGVLKDITIAPRLRFIFLTGISRFSKVSIFSELNNLDDISMSDFYAGLLGYTSEELLTAFEPYLDRFAQQQSWTREQLIAKLAEQYDGYRFAKRDHSVYNPCSILKSLENLDFAPYWFETATPTFLINLLKQSRYHLPNMEGVEVSRAIFSTFELEKLKPTALLFQTGYLTIKAVEGKIFTLGYPNQEVKSAFTESLLLSLAEDAEEGMSSYVLRLANYLRDKDFDAFFEAMIAIFASIPYDIESKRDEAYFHTLFYLMMAASGADARSSILTCKGRIDLAVFFPDTIYIIEFKCNHSADAAIRQIQEKGYTEPYQGGGQQIILIGINFSTEQKNLAEWKVLEMREAFGFDESGLGLLEMGC